MRQLRTLTNISQKYPGSITLHGTSLLWGRTLSPSPLWLLFLLMFSTTRGTARSQSLTLVWCIQALGWSNSTFSLGRCCTSKGSQKPSAAAAGFFFQISSVTEAHILSHSFANRVNLSALFLTIWVCHWLQMKRLSFWWPHPFLLDRS